jgi:hypothetical protein
MQPYECEFSNREYRENKEKRFSLIHVEGDCAKIEHLTPISYLPLVNDCVEIEYLNIDEIEVVCWLTQYNCLGYMDNFNLFLKLKDIHTSSLAYVDSIDPDTGRIELIPGFIFFLKKRKRLTNQHFA